MKKKKHERRLPGHLLPLCKDPQVMNWKNFKDFPCSTIKITTTETALDVCNGGKVKNKAVPITYRRNNHRFGL